MTLARHSRRQSIPDVGGMLDGASLRVCPRVIVIRSIHSLDEGRRHDRLPGPAEPYTMEGIIFHPPGPRWGNNTSFSSRKDGKEGKWAWGHEVRPRKIVAASVVRRTQLHSIKSRQ